MTQDKGATRRRYDRLAGIYDLYDSPMDWLGGRKRRRRVLARARGRVLEVGVGTGRNLGHYPNGIELTGLDLSFQMLGRAASRAAARGNHAPLVHGNAEALPFPDASFDTVAATCVFCSVDDPVQGLAEIRRVVRPGGQVLLLEHVRPRGRVLGWLFDRLSPLVRRVLGPAINRRTEENIDAAGLTIVDVRRDGIWREIVASATSTPADQPS